MCSVLFKWIWFIVFSLLSLSYDCLYFKQVYWIARGQFELESHVCRDCVWNNSNQYSHYNCIIFFPDVTTHCGCIFRARKRALVSSFSRFIDHTQRRATVRRTPLDEWSIRRRDLYLTTHNTHNRQTSMSRVGFEPTISAGERSKTYALDRAATRIGYKCVCKSIFGNWQSKQFRVKCRRQMCV